jgi:hypothetical protein
MTAQSLLPLAPALLLLVPAILNLARWIQLRRHLPAASPSPDSPDSSIPAANRPAWLSDPRSAVVGVRHWIAGHRLETALAAVFAALVIFVVVITPEISPEPIPAPRTPGTPFNAVHFIRDFELKLANDLAYPIGAIGAIASLACLGASFRKRSVDAARVGLLVPGLGLLALWQLINLGFYSADSTTVLIMAGVAVIAWVSTYRLHMMQDVQPAAKLSPAFEVVLLLLAMIPTIVGRTVRLSTTPYGIEGDELKWTVEVVRSMVDGEFVEATEYHLSSLPVSFYLEAPFHRILGPSLLSARIAAVTYSLLGSLAFYALARALFGARVAWLATFLLGVSLLDMSASRLANVESLTKIWPPLALFLLVRAVDTRKLVLFLAAGTAVALGLLAYDTVVPLAAAGMVLLLFELVRNRIPWAESVRHVSAYLAPQLVALPVAAAYIGGRLQYYELGERGLQTDFFGRMQAHAASLLDGLFVLTPRDFLYNRDGPLFQSFLVPWLLLGLVLAVVNWRRGRVVWVLVYFAVFFLPTPILANVPMGRVLFPGIGSAYLLMALALVCAFRELERLLGRDFRPALLTVGSIALFHLAVLNLYIYFHEVQDPEDRRIRRELYEIARESQGTAARPFFPYVQGADEPIQAETQYAIWLGLRSMSNVPVLFSDSPVMPAERLLPALSRLDPAERGVVIVWDTISQATNESRQALLAAILGCFPGRAERPGRYFDQYFLGRAALEAAQCGSGELSLTGSGTEGSSLPLQWSWSGSPISEAVLSCGLVSRDTVSIPAEEFAGPGWSPETRFRRDFRGEAFLIDNYGSGEATYNITLPRTGTYYVWGRTLRRGTDPYGALLTLDETQADFAAPDSTLQEWVWERMGPFPVNRRTPRLAVSRLFGGPPTEFMALFFDEFLLTMNPDFDPDGSTPVDDMRETRLRIPAGLTEGSIDPDLAPGNYTCWMTVSDGSRVVDPLGRIGVESDTVELIVD